VNGLRLKQVRLSARETSFPQMNAQPALVGGMVSFEASKLTSSQQAPHLEVADGQRRVLQQASQLAFNNLRGT
jgi:hypothetical protein